MNVQTIAEVLVDELDKLDVTAKKIETAAPRIEQQVQRLEEASKRPLSVDLSLMKEEHARIKETLSRGVYLPRWMMISFLALVLLLLGTSFGFHHYYKEADKWKDTASHWYDLANP